MFNENLKKCKYCGENIPLSAGRCPYCGSILDEETKDGPNFANVDGTERTEFSDSGQENVGNLPVHDGQVSQGASSQNSGDRSGGFGTGNYYQNVRPTGTGQAKPPLSNGMKVFLTVLFTILPGIGQLAGIITAIVFMNAEGDSDRKSFGVALLVACLALFVISCISCFVISIAFYSVPYVK